MTSYDTRSVIPSPLSSGCLFEDWDQVHHAPIRQELDWRVQGRSGRSRRRGRVLPASRSARYDAGHRDLEPRACESDDGGDRTPNRGEGIGPILDQVLRGTAGHQIGTDQPMPFAKTVRQK